MKKIIVITSLLILLVIVSSLQAGPYTELGINGYVGPDGEHASPLTDPCAIINPIFRGWATGYINYLPSDESWTGPWNNPSQALGPATGDNYDIVSLGDLDEQEILENKMPGEITLTFLETIQNGQGYDFAVFENGFGTNLTGGPGTGTLSGKMLSELAYVEVSSDGVQFARFPSVSLTEQPTGSYGYLTIEVSDVYNLAGKHPNAYQYFAGTPFDLQDIVNDPLVVSGDVNLADINYVRIVDIPGSGDWYDTAMEYIDPCSWPDWDNYEQNHSIYDAWVTWGSGGFDLEAVGVLDEQEYRADIDLNGVVNMKDFTLFSRAWLSHFGEENWIGRCDLAEPRDNVVDVNDLLVMMADWMQRETWSVLQ